MLPVAAIVASYAQKFESCKVTCAIINPPSPITHVPERAAWAVIFPKCSIQLLFLSPIAKKWANA